MAQDRAHLDSRQCGALPAPHPRDDAERGSRLCGGMEIRSRHHGAAAFPDAPLRSAVVPVNINCQGPPLAPLHRAWALGEALRRAADRVPERIAVVGTGGISHWPATPDSGKINEAWDREFLALAGQRPGGPAVLHGRGDLSRRRAGRLRDPHLHRGRRRGAGPRHAASLPAHSDLRRGLHRRRHEHWRPEPCRT